MKRRRFVQAIAVTPAGALVAQQPAPAPSQPPAPASELPQLETTAADNAAEMVPRFFNAQQLAALRRLSEIIMPPMNEAAGAIEAHAPEFLDFLIGQSSTERQQMYRTGLDLLNSNARKRFNKAFAELESEQAGSLLSPLREAWTYDPPSDPLARFLRAAKQDIRTATTNSREYATPGRATGARRGGSGMGLYWNRFE